MKRVDEARVIKVTETRSPNTTAAVANNAAPPQVLSSIRSGDNVTSITRTSAPPSTMPTTPVSLTGTEASGVAIVTLPSALPAVTQALSSLKPETIALPTAPVSVPYSGTTFTANLSAGANKPPTGTPAQAAAVANLVSGIKQVPSTQAPVQVQQQQSHQQQVLQQKVAQQTVNYGPPSIRTITGALSALPTTQGASVAAAQVAAANIQAAPTSSPINAGSAQFQKLKVEDALSYLDQVKFRFGNQPQVYNDFLDIMKEFKSQSIDTPGVIARVSSLFKGHPELIVGFNTFLPPGYKIEVQCTDTVSVSVPGMIGTNMQTIVHTPTGIHTMGAHGAMSALQPNTTISAGIRPVPLPLQPTLASQPAKFTPVKSEGLLPQQPVPAHGQSGPHNSGPVNVGIMNSGAASVPAAPVEFNHAINYVNKIKSRFQRQPEVYKQFLEILHTYQKDQKALKEGAPLSGKFLTETEVYSQVSKLFQNQDDLLSEFGQFLPEATNDQSLIGAKSGRKSQGPGLKGFGGQGMSGLARYGSGDLGQQHGYSSGKRPPSGLTHPAPKKQKMGVLKDVSLAEAGKYGTLNEFAFFDKVRKALRSPEVYNNFLRCLVLFNQEVISRQELLQLSANFLQKHPDLFKWFKDFVGTQESHLTNQNSGLNSNHMPTAPGPGRDRIGGDSSAMEIDYATCKRLGASYCALPRQYVQPKCTGRTPLCREVLNDTWVSFPSWSEDSQFVTSRKTQFEELIYRTEDERFEFDVVLETNKDTIKVLECVQKKMSRMPPEEAARYKLDDCLGGSSPTIHQRAIRRIYGDKALDIIDGLKRNPVVAVPLVLRRLRAKDEEWRDVQKNFHKVWREQNEKYYLKSLDHQGILFKQTDIRSLRSKALLSEIETLYDERHEQEEQGSADQLGPHMHYQYDDEKILEDANNLLIHHVKRQPTVHKDKQKIKALLKHFLMDLFQHSRQELSDDEKEMENASEENQEAESDNDKESGSVKSESQLPSQRTRKKNERYAKKDDGGGESSKEDAKVKAEVTEADIKVPVYKDGRKTPLHARDAETGETYSLLMANNNWYIFMRLHYILCNRLFKIYNQGLIMAGEAKEPEDQSSSAAIALKLKPKRELPYSAYYATFLDMVKNLLDGNLESNAYEDALREMFGIHAYVAFTLDKVISYAVRQLQQLVTDEAAVECHELYHSEAKNFATGGSCETAADRIIPELIYQKKAEKLLSDENCMKIFIYHQSKKVTIEMLDTETDSQSSEQEDMATEKWQSYVDKFLQPGDVVSDECKEHLAKKPVFLPRGIRSYAKSPFGQMKLQNQHGQARGTVTEAEPKNGPSDDSETDKNESKPDPSKKENNGIIHDDSTQCQFNPKTLKILYVIDSENCFYRKQALRRAKQSHKQVSLRKAGDFNKWHQTWLRQHVSDHDQKNISEWFMGKHKDLLPNKTTQVVQDDPDRAPYRRMIRFKAEIIKDGAKD